MPVNNYPTHPKNKAASSHLTNWLVAHKMDILLGAIFLLTAILYAILMFTDRVPFPGLISLGVLWLIYVLVGGRLSFATPLDLPILGLIALLPLSLAISTNWSLSLPKVYGLILSIVVFYIAVNAVRNYQNLYLAIVALIILSIGVALVGLIGADWSDNKVLSLPQIYDRLPRLIDSIPRIPQGEGINANTIGGALTFFVPLLVSLFFDGGAFQRKYLAQKTNSQALVITHKLLVLFALILVSSTLLLTQSRSAYLGTAIGVLAFAIWKDRRWMWLIPVLLIGFLVVSHHLTSGDIPRIFSVLDTRQDVTLPYRTALWEGSIAMIQDFPLTGTGLGTYGLIYTQLYAFSLFTSVGPFAAHNTFLSVAIDLGIPALVLYTALLSSFAYMILRSYKVGRSIYRVVLMGLGCGMLAHQVFGMTDAFVLGTKLGVIMWIYFGLVAGLYIHKQAFYWKVSMSANPAPLLHMAKPTVAQVMVWLQRVLLGLGYWICFSLMAISFVTLNAYLGTGLAIGGGILLGVTLSRLFKTDSLKPAAEN